jgi:glycosyl transferase family 25
MTMMQTFVINLDRAPDRLERLGGRLRAQGVAFERLPAVDARLLGDADIERHVDGIGYWGRLTRGEVACFLSHRACWQRIVDRGLPHGVVLEDDVVPGEDVGALFSNVDWVPPDADLVKLETNRKPVWLARGHVAQAARHVITRLYSSHDCTAAYVVTRHAAQRLLQETLRFRDEVDELLFTERSPLHGRLVNYQVDPAPFVQERWLEAVEPSPDVDPNTTIEEREQKVRRPLSRSERLVEYLGQGRRDGTQAVMEFLGRRRTTVVGFR